VPGESVWGPVPITATVAPGPRKPPRCAAVSMPSAMPEMMVRPAALSDSENFSAFTTPCVVALRLPTTASAGVDSNSVRPFAYSSTGGSGMSSSAGG